MNGITQARRRGVLAAPLVLGAAGRAAAQGGRVTRIIVPVPPGGGMDASARLLAEFAPREVLGPVIVENRPGGALRLAVETVQRAEPDGRTLLFAPGSVFTIYPHIYRRLTYDVRTDFAPISTFSSTDLALGVPGTSPANDLAGYLAMVRREGGRSATFGIPAAGTSLHFAGAELARLSGIALENVPYRGSAPLMQDLLGGNLPAAFNLAGEFVQPKAAGRVKVLATSGERRAPLMPDIPTFGELGYPGLTKSEWFGLFAPARTPPAVVEALNAAVAAATANPEVASRVLAMGYAPLHAPSAAFAARVLAERASWEPIVKATGFSVEE